jgi:hypothetical protein
MPPAVSSPELVRAELRFAHTTLEPVATEVGSSSVYWMNRLAALPPEVVVACTVVDFFTGSRIIPVEVPADERVEIDAAMSAILG